MQGQPGISWLPTARPQTWQNRRPDEVARLGTRRLGNPTPVKADEISGPSRPGTVCDRYLLGDVVGLGGAATVYRAWDRRADRPVALKLYREGIADTDRPPHRAEVAALTKLRHPGLVALYDAGVDADRVYIAMQMIEGETLAQRIRNGPLSTAAVTAMGATLADTLSYVHARGIVHRDIKPANVLLDGHDRPFLTDFGVARLIDATRTHGNRIRPGNPRIPGPGTGQGPTSRARRRHLHARPGVARGHHRTAGIPRRRGRVRGRPPASASAATVTAACLPAHPAGGDDGIRRCCPTRCGAGGISPRYGWPTPPSTPLAATRRVGDPGIAKPSTGAGIADRHGRDGRARHGHADQSGLDRLRTQRRRPASASSWGQRRKPVLPPIVFPPPIAAADQPADDAAGAPLATDASVARAEIENRGADAPPSPAGQAAPVARLSIDEEASTDGSSRAGAQDNSNSGSHGADKRKGKRSGQRQKGSR